MGFSQLNNNNSILDKFGIDMQKSNKDLIKEHQRLVKVLRSKSHADDKKEADKQEDELEEYEDKEMEKSKKGEGSRGGIIIGHTKSGNAIYKLHDVRPPKVFGIRRAEYRAGKKSVSVIHSDYDFTGSRSNSLDSYSMVYDDDEKERKFKGDNQVERLKKYLKKKYGIDHDPRGLKRYGEGVKKSDDNDLMKADTKKDKEQSYKYNPGSIQHSIQTVISKLLPAKDKGFKLPVGKWNKEGDKIDYMAQVSFDAAQPRPPFHKMKQMIADELGIEGSKVIVQSLGKEDIEPEKKLKEGEKPQSQWRAHIIITVPKQQMEQLSLRDHFDDNEEQEMKARQREKQMGKMKKSDNEEFILDLDLDAIEQELESEAGKIARQQGKPELGKIFDTALNDIKNVLNKAEGSRGGHVIGHTKSGKPIYSNNSHPDHDNFTSEEHREAAEHHRRKVGDMNDNIRNADKTDYSTRNHYREKRAHHRKQAELHESSASMREREERDK